MHEILTIAFRPGGPDSKDVFQMFTIEPNNLPARTICSALERDMQAQFGNMNISSSIGSYLRSLAIIRNPFHWDHGSLLSLLLLLLLLSDYYYDVKLASREGMPTLDP